MVRQHDLNNLISLADKMANTDEDWGSVFIGVCLLTASEEIKDKLDDIRISLNDIKREINSQGANI